MMSNMLLGLCYHHNHIQYHLNDMKYDYVICNFVHDIINYVNFYDI